MSFIGALDQGTTSTRFIVFDKAGGMVSTAQLEHKQYFPRPAWVEHDAEEIWTRSQECITAALVKAGIKPADLAAVGITNQRETVVVWDRRDGRVLHNALVWQDQRGAELCDKLKAEHGEAFFRRKTGLPIVPYFSATKLVWLLDNVPGLRQEAEAGHALAGTIDTFLLWKLTGVHATDLSNACRTLLLDIESCQWDAQLCSIFNVPMVMLPQVLPSSGVFGVCRQASVLPGVPVAGILGDQQAALFGQTCFEPGEAKNTYGTGCFLLMNTGTRPVQSSHGMLTTVAYQLSRDSPPVYALEGSVAAAGAVISWCRDNLKIIGSARESETLAVSVPDNGGVVFVPAFNGLFAPHWRSDARGLLVGLTGYSTQAHVMRAALESVAHQSRDLLEAMEKDMQMGTGRAEGGAAGAGEELAAASAAAGAVVDGAAGGAGAVEAAASGKALRVDGGMTGNDFLMQFQADICGRAILRPAVAETTALGAAYAAGLAVGFWKDLQELRSHWKVEKQYSPAMAPEQQKQALALWKAALSRSFGWGSVAAAALAGSSSGAAATPTSVSSLSASRRSSRVSTPNDAAAAAVAKQQQEAGSGAAPAAAAGGAGQQQQQQSNGKQQSWWSKLLAEPGYAVTLVAGISLGLLLGTKGGKVQW